MTAIVAKRTAVQYMTLDSIVVIMIWIQIFKGSFNTISLVCLFTSNFWQLTPPLDLYLILNLLVAYFGSFIFQEGSRMILTSFETQET